jgi:hypothetical protein
MRAFAGIALVACLGSALPAQKGGSSARLMAESRLVAAHDGLFSGGSFNEYRFTSLMVYAQAGR